MATKLKVLHARRHDRRTAARCSATERADGPVVPLRCPPPGDGGRDTGDESGGDVVSCALAVVDETTPIVPQHAAGAGVGPADVHRWAAVPVSLTPAPVSGAGGAGFGRRPTGTASGNGSRCGNQWVRVFAQRVCIDENRASLTDPPAAFGPIGDRGGGPISGATPRNGAAARVP